MWIDSDYSEGTMAVLTETKEGEDISLENIDLSGFDKDDIPINFGVNDNLLPNDVAHQAIEIREKEDVRETTPPTSIQIADNSIPVDTSSGIPPLDNVVPSLH